MRVASKDGDSFSIIGYCDYTTEKPYITFKKPDGLYQKPLSQKDTPAEYTTFEVVDLTSESEGAFKAILVDSIDSAREAIPGFKTLYH